MAFAVGASEFDLVLLLTILIVVPVAGVAFARSGKALENLGKGRFAIDRDDDSPGAPKTAEVAGQERAEEVRQMLEAADFRSRARGDGRMDVEGELERLMTQPDAWIEAEGDSESGGPSSGEGDLREEIRQLVVANNERRTRRGEDPLDIDEEIEKRLRDWS